MICTVCNRQSMGGLTHPVCKTRYSIDGVFPSLVYKGMVKKLVYTFKYPPYLTDLQTQLGELFYEGIIQKELFYQTLSTESVFVPIPLHKKKLRKRGYNQSYLLAKQLSQRLNIPIVDVLSGVKETQTQVGLSKADRAENIKNAFAI